MGYTEQAHVKDPNLCINIFYYFVTSALIKNRKIYFIFKLSKKKKQIMLNNKLFIIFKSNLMQ